MKATFEKQTNRLLHVGPAVSENQYTKELTAEEKEMVSAGGSFRYESGQLVRVSGFSSPVVLTPLAFIEKLTDSEKVGIFTSTNPGVVVFRSMAIAAREIRSDDPRTIDGLGYLVSVGLLTESRVAALLS